MVLNLISSIGASRAHCACSSMKIVLEHFGVSVAGRGKEESGLHHFLRRRSSPAERLRLLPAYPNIIKKSGRVFSAWGLSEGTTFATRTGVIHTGAATAKENTVIA